MARARKPPPEAAVEPAPAASAEAAAVETRNDSAIGRRRLAAKDESSVGYQQRRREIADAAAAVFNRVGFKAASVGAIVAEMRMDRATFYYYFASKEELFDEVVRTVIERNAELALRIEAAPVSPKRKLHDLLTAFMASYSDTYPILYIYIRENLNHVSDQRSAWSAHMRRMNAQISDSIIRIIEQGYGDGSFWRVGDPRIVAYALLGMLNWTHRWYRPETSPWSAQEIGEVLSNLATLGLDSPYPRDA